jgi:hypothetical protein
VQQLTEKLPPSIPNFDLQPALIPAAKSSMLRDITDPISSPEPLTDATGPIEVTPEDPSAIPGEVLWGFTPRTGLTGTIELNPKDKLSGSRPNDDSGDDSKKQRLGKFRKKRD